MIDNLIQVLKKKDKSKTLSVQLEEIRSKSKSLLDKVIAVFPDYTPHDIEHKDRVIDYMKLIIPESLIDQMNAYEVFYLLSAAYVHDIGMSDLEGLQQYSAGELKGKERTDFIRDHHHLRSEEFITKFHEEFKIERISDARIIGRIARGHRVDDLMNEELYSREDAIGGNITVNIALLANILRIADELDLSFARIPMIVYEHIPPIDQISKHEWEKHNSCKPPTLLAEELSLVVSADCFSSEVHRSLKRLEDKLNEQVEQYPELLHYYASSRKDLPRKFEMRITSHGYKPRDFRFSLNEKHIARLLMGDQLYSEKSESLREILKNSIDACRLRKAILSKDNPQFRPYVSIELSEDGKALKIYDNGVGMDEDFVERYLTKIGNSFYQSEEFRGKQFSFTPVGELGIGLLSYFMIADTVQIDTKTETEKPLRIEIRDIEKYFIISDGVRVETRTTVTLHLKNALKESDIHSWVSRYAKHIDFPIEVKSGNIRKPSVIDKGFHCSYESFFEKSHTNPKDYFAISKINVNTPELEGIIAFLVPTRAFQEDVWRKTDIRHTDRKRFSLSYNGILISENPDDLLVEALEHHNMFYDINMKSKIVDLNAARNKVVYNAKLAELQRRVSTMLVKKVKTHVMHKFPGGAIKHSGAEINRFVRFFVELDSLRRHSERERDLPRTKDALQVLTPLLATSFYLRVIKDNVLKYKTFAQIKNEQIFVISRLDNVTDYYITELFAKSKVIKESLIIGHESLSLFMELSKVYPLTAFFEVGKGVQLDLANINISTNMFLSSNLRTLGLHWSYLEGPRGNQWVNNSFAYNQNHPFIELINSRIRSLSIVDKTFCALVFSEIGKLKADHFFIYKDANKIYEHIAKIQKQALEQLVKSGVIRKNSINKFAITKDDFETVMR